MSNDGQRNATPLQHSTPKLPQGVQLMQTLQGQNGPITNIAWSPDGQVLASSSWDGTVQLWNPREGKCLRSIAAHEGTAFDVTFSPKGDTVLTGGRDSTVKLWEAKSGKLLRSEESAGGNVRSVAFDRDGVRIAAGGDNLDIWEIENSQFHLHRPAFGNLYKVIFDPTSDALMTVDAERGLNFWSKNLDLRTSLKLDKLTPLNAAFHPATAIVASANGDGTLTFYFKGTVQEWPHASGLFRTFEGHTDQVINVIYSSDGELVASKSTHDGTVRIWESNNGACLAVIPFHSIGQFWTPGLAFHPSESILASVVSHSKSEPDTLIQIWKIDRGTLRHLARETTICHYSNARVILLGDTGVGKSGLSKVLLGNPFEATDSTAGRKVFLFRSQEMELTRDVRRTCETFLWDLAGQPGYRIIHQLHLNEVAVALIVFDARNETDPLSGVLHWVRALRLAEQRQGACTVPLRKFLVSARTDRGIVSVSKSRLEGICKELGFDAYFETSAKEGWQVKELRLAIEQAIDWERLPTVTSSVVFVNIKAFLLKAKETGIIITPIAELFDKFLRETPGTAAPDLRAQFETCIGRFENRDIVRRLSFGGYLLLQPELLDSYASAMVHAAKKEPDGLGSLGEDIALAGKFYVPDEQKLKDPGQEQLLLHATVEELVRHDLALRESASEGRYLVFPSEFNRDYEGCPEPTGRVMTLGFDGPVQSLYATLVVRLAHSGLFSTGRAEMWRNAAIFTARAGGKCGLHVKEFAEGRGRLEIFYASDGDLSPSDETRFNFEEFVQDHTRRRAIEGTIEVSRAFVCENCNESMPDGYVRRLQQRGIIWFDCPCGSRVSLTPPRDGLRFASQLIAMAKAANHHQALDMFVQSALGETRSTSFREWAGDDRVTLAIVFTDVVGATALGEELKDDSMNEIRRAHFAQSRKLIQRHNGREIKTIGDSFMAAFHSIEKALDFARALQADTGHPRLSIRAGINVGPMYVEEEDVFGGAVNFAARVMAAIQHAEIWLSDRAKVDLDSCGAKQHRQLTWQRHEEVELKGFGNSYTLWSLIK